MHEFYACKRPDWTREEANMEEGQGSLGRVGLIGEGQIIPVSVESVFRDGFVVSFITGDGLFEYRGALLCQQSSWCNRQSAILNGPLANPLTLLHDHPYTNMKQYVKHITNFPAEVVHHWNSPPSTLPVYPANLQEIAERRERPLASKITERAIHVVEADPESELYNTFPCYVPGLERQAKVLAQLRMRANLAKNFRRSPPLERSKVKKRSPAPNFKVKAQRMLSPGAAIHETACLKKPLEQSKVKKRSPAPNFKVKTQRVPSPDAAIHETACLKKLLERSKVKKRSPAPCLKVETQKVLIPDAAIHETACLKNPLEQSKVKKRSPAPNFKVNTERMVSPDAGTQTTLLKGPSRLPKRPPRPFSIHITKVPVRQNCVRDDDIIVVD